MLRAHVRFWSAGSRNGPFVRTIWLFKRGSSPASEPIRTAPAMPRAARMKRPGSRKHSLVNTLDSRCARFGTRRRAPTRIISLRPARINARRKSKLLAERCDSVRGSAWFFFAQRGSSFHLARLGNWRSTPPLPGKSGVKRPRQAWHVNCYALPSSSTLLTRQTLLPGSQVGAGVAFFDFKDDPSSTELLA